MGRALNFFGLVAFTYAAITIPFPDAPIFVKYIIGILLGVAVVWTYAAFARAAWTKWSRWHHHKLLKEAQHSADTAGAAEGKEAEHS